MTKTRWAMGKKQKSSRLSSRAFLLCGRGDLNSHGSPHYHLKVACLPIPPRPLGCLSESLLTRRLRNAWDSGDTARNSWALRSAHIAKDLRCTFRLNGLLDRRPAGLLSNVKTRNHQIDREYHYDQSHSPPLGQLRNERVGTSAGERLASASTAERPGKAAGFVVLHKHEADEDHAAKYMNENQSPEKEVHWVRKNRAKVFL